MSVGMKDDLEVERQRYHNALFSHPNFDGVTYDAATHVITISTGPIFDKLWDDFMESEKSHE